MPKDIIKNSHLFEEWCIQKGGHLQENVHGGMGTLWTRCSFDDDFIQVDAEGGRKMSVHVEGETTYTHGGSPARAYVSEIEADGGILIEWDQRGTKANTSTFTP